LSRNTHTQNIICCDSLTSHVSHALLISLSFFFSSPSVFLSLSLSSLIFCPPRLSPLLLKKEDPSAWGILWNFVRACDCLCTNLCLVLVCVCVCVWKVQRAK